MFPSGESLMAAPATAFLDAMLLQFFEKHHLIRIIAGEAIRRMHVKAINYPAISKITQMLQSRPLQGGAADAFIKETEFRVDPTAIGRDALAKGGHLASDRQFVGLFFGTDARVQCNPSNVIHDVRPSWIRLQRVGEHRSLPWRLLPKTVYGARAKSLDRPMPTTVPPSDGIHRPSAQAARPFLECPP
jgi:hypothetical protein